jgi:integrase
MASIRRRRGKWQAQVRRRGAPAQSATFPTRAAAKRWASRLEREIDEGRALSGVAVTGTVRELIQRYEREIEPIRPIGRSKRSALGRLKTDLDAVKLRDLTAGRVIRFARERHAGGAGPVTIGVDLSYLGTVLRTARALWRLAVNDAAVGEARDALRMIGLVARSRERDRRPTVDEIAALCAHWRSNSRQIMPMAELTEFAIASAMRLGEICRIAWRDLDQAARTVIIRDRKDPREKRGNDQVVPLLDVSGYDALGIILRQPRTADRIFPYNERSVSTVFTRACAELGIDDLQFHDLRHEGTSRLFEAGLDVPQVQLISGHRRWDTLRRYTHLRPADVTAAFPARQLQASAEEPRPDTEDVDRSS